MTSDFEEELNRGKAKLSAEQMTAESRQKEQERLLEAKRRKSFEYFELHGFTALESWPTSLQTPENIVLRRFISGLKTDLPKIIPHVIKLEMTSDDRLNTSQSEMDTIGFGAYMGTKFEATAEVEIPSFSSIKVTWEAEFNREKAASYENIKPAFRFAYKVYSEGNIEKYQWNSYNKDFDIVLVKAKEQYESIKTTSRNERRGSSMDTARRNNAGSRRY